MSKLKKCVKVGVLGVLNIPFSALIFTTLTVMFAGCESVNDWMTAERVNYQGAQIGPDLAVPKDLPPLSQNQYFVLSSASTRFVIAPQSRSVDTVKTHALVSKNKEIDSAIGMKVEKEEGGPKEQGRYWLVLSNIQLNTLWSQLRVFWQTNGFTLKADEFKLGWLETDWAENRAQIPNDWFRKATGKWTAFLYSSGTLDKFRTFVKSDANGTLRLTIQHDGMEEVLVGRHKESSIWQERPRNPELEKAFLSRLMQALGVSEERAQTHIKQAESIVPRVIDVKR